MNISNIETKINEIIQDSENRKIVMWYDESKEFVEEINNINLEDAELFILENDNWIYAKYYIESENPETNFLIYAPFRKPVDKDNYLTDMTYYATLFSANKIDIITQELNIPSTLKDVLTTYSNFWNANTRINAFKELNIPEYHKKSIELGILTVLANEKTTNFENIVRKIIFKHFDEENDKIIEEFDKYNILDVFWDFIYQKFGYKENNPTIGKFTISLVLNYTAYLFEGKPPKSWQRFLVDDKNNPSVFIDNFMNNTKFIKTFDKISGLLEEKLNISRDIKNNSVDSYIKCDSFKIFDKNIIEHYINVLYETKEKMEFDEILKEREKRHFYKCFEYEYQMIYWANEFIGLINDFQRESLPDDVNELVELFTNKFVKIDRAYRKFYYNYDLIEETGYIEDLRVIIENMYANVFLFEINPKFTSLFDKIEDITIPKQWKFYKNNVSNKTNKIAVVISDGLRYGCGIELKEELDKNPTWNNTIKPMLSTVPSYTALGMASLLPNKEIKYENDTILVDGKPCASTTDREKILNSYNSHSVAITYKEINQLNQSGLRSLTKGKDVLYIYHNKIDKTGDEAITENEVFSASQDTINEISKLVTQLIDSAGFTQVLITADHGFIYKRDKLEESDKVNLDKIDSFHKNKRFLLTYAKTELSGTKCLSLDYIGNKNIYVTVPKGVNIFKAPGAGLNYVHGGLSLEEVIVPLIAVKSKAGGKNQRTVELQLITSNHKLTNYETMLYFFQKENVSKTVLPLEASIYFEDDDGNKISNEVIIFADKDSDYAEDREFREKFTLKRMTYSKTKPYYLIIKDASTDLEIDRVEFMIDIAFQDGFDFF